MKSRYKAIVSALAAVLLFTVLFSLYGYNNTWRLWNIPVVSPHFSDLRPITHGAESFAQGLDPMIENPGDPWQRELNYPRVWQGLYALGLNETHTTALGIVVIASFLIGVCLFLPYASTLTTTLVFLAVLSPAALLGIERGNTDLFIFFLASVSIVAAQRSYLLSGVVIFTGFILKLFPIFGWAVLFGSVQSRFVRYTLGMLVFASFYIVATFSDILLIKEGTPQGVFLSYGLNVFWMFLGLFDESLEMYARALTYISAFLILVFALSALWRNDQRQELSNDAMFLDAFRAGSAIYMGTFLLGNNWDYRLIFLIFTIPQLVIWAKHSAACMPLVSKLTLAMIFISLWHSVIGRLLIPLPYGQYLTFALDEAANWGAFSCLAYLFLWSAPSWVREGAQKMYPSTNHSI